MIKLWHNIVSWPLKRRMERLEWMANRPEDAQESVFHTLLSKGRGTHWGEVHGYGKIRNVADYQKQVPISTYEEFFPWIKRVLDGEANVLWPGKVSWFAKSSGTTNDKSKFIPVTQDSLEYNHFAGGRDLTGTYLSNRSDSRLFTGKVLSIGGSHEISQYNERARYGDISAVLIENLPSIFQLQRAPSKKVALMSEWESKIEQMAQECISNPNITGVVGVPTWTLVLINRLFELQQVKERNLFEVLPNLEVFFHGAVSFVPYRQQFQELLPSDEMWYVESYNASEGFFGLQDTQEHQGMLILADHGVFYEFIPMDEFGSENPSVKTLTEVEPGVNYAMVISTNSGLWRYLIGDTVEFVSVRPYRVKVTGRTKHSINAFGEEVVVGNTDAAIAATQEKLRGNVKDYTAAPIYFSGKENGAHEWVIEFEQAPEQQEQFLSTIDAELQRLNTDYAAKRYRSMALRPPTFHVVPKGTFYEWMRQRGKLGGQNKVPRLSNSREYVESILELLKQQGTQYHTLQAEELPANGK